MSNQQAMKIALLAKDIGVTEQQAAQFLDELEKMQLPEFRFIWIEITGFAKRIGVRLPIDGWTQQVSVAAYLSELNGRTEREVA